MDLANRVFNRLENADEDVLKEYIVTIKDRLCLRLGEEDLPEQFESICVDAVVKMYRRMYYEGIVSEGTSNLTTSFVDDILAEYSQEISDWKVRKANDSGSGRVVRFL